MTDFPQKPPGEFILYQSADGQTRIHLKVASSTVWLTQLQIADLFQTSKQNVSLHIRNVLKERELSAESVVKEYLTTAATGSNTRRSITGSK